MASRRLSLTLPNDGDDDVQLRGLRQEFVGRVALPTPGSVIGESLTVIEVHYDGNPRRGLTARCRTADGSEHVVALADVRFPEGSEAARHAARYHAWLSGGTRREVVPRQSGRGSAMPGDIDIDLSRPVELAVISVKDRAARCRLLGTDRTITVRSRGFWDTVPGEIITLQPRKQWRYARHPYLSGEMIAARLDVSALGLVPLRLESLGTWDPAEEYWGEEARDLEEWERAVIAAGPRPEFEMEQVLPGADPDDPDADPILEANELRERGHVPGARRILMGLLEADLRCLDAHAHLGNLAFDHWPQEALRHYEVGRRIGDLSLPDGFGGVLRWSAIDNRPFLRCLQNAGLCLWRLGRWDEATALFERMLWLNPADQQGIRFLIRPVRDRQRWEDQDW